MLIGQYFTNDNLKSELKEFDVSLMGVKLSLLSDNGVFSKNGVDFGTKVLLSSLPKELLQEPLLDVGCGYGPIGLSIAKSLGIETHLIDVNKRALHLTELNAKRNDIHNVSIYESDCYSNVDNNIKFRTIVTNPPIRAGKKVVYEILFGARFHLADDGNLFIVVRKEQGAKSMHKDLSEFYNVEILNKEKGYFIFKCTLKNDGNI
jgi:16S rRNA (guanine1207-N2)-methyltransferase